MTAVDCGGDAVPVSAVEVVGTAARDGGTLMDIGITPLE
jgi:hypothetical protein